MLESVNDEDSSYQNIEQTVPEITVCNSFKVSTVDRLNHFKESALHLATCYASTSLIGKLIEKGADVNGKDSEGRTPLHRAVKTNTSQSVELLLCKGADANALDKNMETPIFIAHQTNSGTSIYQGARPSWRRFECQGFQR